MRLVPALVRWAIAVAKSRDIAQAATLKHDTDLVFSRIVLPRGAADIIHDTLGGGFGMRPKMLACKHHLICSIGADALSRPGHKWQRVARAFLLAWLL